MIDRISIVICRALAAAQRRIGIALRCAKCCAHGSTMGIGVAYQ